MVEASNVVISIGVKPVLTVTVRHTSITIEAVLFLFL